MKHMFKSTLLVFASAMLLGQAAQAETVVSVTEIHYDSNQRADCVAVRMNTATFANVASNACARTDGGANAFGPDRITKTVYDAAGQVTQVIEAYGVTGMQRAYSSFAYSPNGKVVDTVDANGNRTHMEYDGFDRLATYRYPSPTRPSAFNPTTVANAIATAGAQSTTDYEVYTYDANGNRTTYRRRDGQVLTDCYDALNRSVIHYLHAQVGCTATGGVADIYTNYDLQGHVVSRRFASFSGWGVSYAYDGLGRVTSTTDMNNRTVGYEYNLANARTKLTYPDGVYVGYGLDNASRVVSVGWNATSNLFGQSYDNLGRLAMIAKGSVASTSYDYDNLGRLTSMTNNLSGTVNDITWSFNNYNPAGQIASWGANSTWYDNLEKVANTDARAYDGLNRDGTLVGTSAACPVGGYDARGNLICDGARSFTYDVENRLLTAGGGSAALNLSYDPEGRLYRYTAGSAVTTFLYDGTDLIGEYNGDTTTVLRRYIHGTGTDDPIAWTEGSGSAVHFLWSNYQGSIIAHSDAFGIIGDTYKYGPYGEPKDVNNNNSWSGFRFRYTGQLILPEAQLYYYKARVYDPAFGRFLQTDPVGSKDDLDLYAYVGGDPINKSDPTGLAPPANMGPGTIAHKEFTIKARSFFGQYLADLTVGRVGGDPKRPRPDLIELSTKYIWELKSINEIPRGRAEASQYSEMTKGEYTPGENAPKYFMGNVDIIPLTPSVDIIYTFVGDGVITYQYRDNPEREARVARQVETELSTIKNLGAGALVAVGLGLSILVNPLAPLTQ